MKAIKRLLKKISSKDKKKSKVKHQFQEIALEIAREMGINGKDKIILFGFIKNKMKKGQWWKIKEVREYMASKNIKSLRYFMACFNHKKKWTKKEPKK